jgi:phosphoserine phosphatase RsbU/P
MSDDAAVLIIDDDVRTRFAFRCVLEPQGVSVLEAEDGASGLRVASERTLGAVLLDLRMPGMDGLDVLQALVRMHPETPVLVVSGRGTMSDVVEALRRGAWDFILKPVTDIDLLVRAVGRALDKATLQRQNREFSESLQRTNNRLNAALKELSDDEQAARKLQFQLLPEDGLRIGSYTCSRRLFPSQVLSGDFVDYFPLGERHLGFYMADVAGHGAASAFVTAMLTTLVGKYREALGRGDETILSPRQFLARLESDLAPHRLEKHITMFYGALETSSGQFVYASAGAFPFPFLRKGDHVVELECTGRPLNLPGRAGFGYGEAELLPGGRLLIASDGVLEIEPKQSFRERRAALAEITRSATDLDAVLAGLGFREATQRGDDVALFLLAREESRG